MGLSKRTRFEVFKRDGFTCQYCGQTPPTVILEVDHINPRANGGTDVVINLITACFDCNRGKADKKLGDIHPRPDADLKYLETQQEIVEAKRYLESSEILFDLRNRIKLRLLDAWAQHIEADIGPNEIQYDVWLKTYSPEEIEYGFLRAGVKYHKPYGGFGGSSPSWITAQVVKYATAVMRNVKKEAEEGG